MPDTAYPARSTPFPSRLLDDVMPLLSDTEWRIVCVLVRSTFGWEDGQGGRKQADWLTQAQLKARTGRASEALSRAIDGLVRKGLILVCSEDGEPLATPQERRRCVGRMLFCITPQALDAPQEAQNSTHSAPNAPLQAEEREEDQDTSRSLSEEGSSQNKQGSSFSEPRYSFSEVRKAKTTKESKDKTTPDGVAPQKQAEGDKSVENSARGRTRKGEAATAPPGGVSDVSRFLLSYQELFQQHSAQGEAPPIAWGRDGKLVKGLLAQYGYERLTELLTRFFASEDAWVKKRGYALACFPTLLPTLLMQDGRGNDVGRRASATPVVIPSVSAPLWQQIEQIKVSDTSLFERHPDLARRVRGQTP